VAGGLRPDRTGGKLCGSGGGALQKDLEMKSRGRERKPMKTQRPFLRLLILLMFFFPLATASVQSAGIDDCMMEALKTAGDDLTVGQLRQRCEKRLAEAQEKKAPGSEKTPEKPAQEADSAIEQRVDQERKTQFNPFVITPHKPNYMLPVTYLSSPNHLPFASDERKLERVEMKFQFSFKLPLAENLLWGNGDLYFAYTNLSFWQAYNSAISSPFRETNHEPELFLDFDSDIDLMGVTNRKIIVGAVHQSNGRSGSLSRSWNRLYADFLFEKGDFYFSLKPWLRIPESPKKTPDDPSGDDNPDILKYMGYGEFSVLYKMGTQSVGVMLRNNLRSDNMGAVQIDWTFPMTRRLKGYVQYFNGYGESLIDYNTSSNRIGAGLLLTDWL
jgi:phospholipase A1